MFEPRAVPSSRPAERRSRRAQGRSRPVLSQLIVFASALNCRNSNNFGHGVWGFPPTRGKHYGTAVISTGRFFSLRWKLEVRTSIKPGVSFTSLGLHWFTPANQNDENENENNAVCTVYTRKPTVNQMRTNQGNFDMRKSHDAPKPHPDWAAISIEFHRLGVSIRAQQGRTEYPKRRSENTRSVIGGAARAPRTIQVWDIWRKF